jgi:uncharacterized cupin superfamily protein
MAKIDVNSIRKRAGSGYPAPFNEPVANRERQPLGDAAGLTQFGVNLLQLPPGAWSSQRHWHAGEDEFVYVVSGEVVLVTDAGEEILRAGDCAGFAKGVQDGHHLINHSKTTTAVCLEVGTRAEVDYCGYPDIDMVYDSKVGDYAHRDGKVYPPKQSAKTTASAKSATAAPRKRRQSGR